MRREFVPLPAANFPQMNFTQMHEHLFDVLEETGGMNIPLQRDRGEQQNLRSPEKKKAADFPAELYAKPEAPPQHN